MDKKATDTDELDVNGNPQGDTDIHKKAPVSGDEGEGKRVSFLLKTEDIDVSGDLVIDENILHFTVMTTALMLQKNVLMTRT